MRFNELISGVRSDVAVKVFGERFEDMVPAANAIASVLSSIPGAADVKVEQTEGLPIMNIDINRAAISRYGLNVADVQETIAVAIGGAVTYLAMGIAALRTLRKDTAIARPDADLLDSELAPDDLR